MSTGAVDLSEAIANSAARTNQPPRAVDLACRLLDVTVAMLLLIALAPLMVVIAGAIQLDSPGPVLFRQRRLGRSLTPFTVHKFRSMRDGVSDAVHKEFVLGLIAGAQPTKTRGNARFKLVADDRVTRVGRILRRASLDELPQLWNVVRGQMSLVGPRPPIQYEVEHYPPNWFVRFDVKPGVTGLWQVSGRSELTHEQMIKLDAEYVGRRSLWLNLWILVRTIPVVLSARGAS